MSSDNKKLDILIRIGVIMILLSGIIFATTNWKYFNDVSKVLMLLIGGVVFRTTAFITEHKLKLEKSSFGYWIVASFFFVFSLISVGYFKIFGDWYSFSGGGNHILISNIYALIAGILIKGYHKRKKEGFLYFAWFFLYSMLYELLLNLNIDYSIAFLIISAIVFISNFLAGDHPYLKTFNKFNEFFIYALSFMYLFIFDKSTIVNILFIVIALGDIIVKKYETKNSHSSVMLPIITSSLIIRLMYSFNLQLNTTCLNIIVILSIFALIYSFLKDELLTEFGFALNDLIGAAFLIVLLFVNKTDFFLGTIALLAICIISIVCNKNSKYQFISNPFKILLSCVGLSVFLNDTCSINYHIIFTLSSFIFLILSYVSKTRSLKIINYFINIFLLLAISLSVSSHSLMYTILLFILAINTTFNMFVVDKELSDFKIFNYLFTILFSYIFINRLFVNMNMDVLISIIAIMIFMLLSFYKLDDKKLSLKISLIANAIPLLQLINSVDVEYTNLIIGVYSFILALLYEFVFKPRKNGVVNLLCAIPMIILFFESNIFDTIALGIILICFIIYTYNKDEYRKLFTFSRIELIVMIIIKLADFWKQVPLWLYLFIGGVVVIMFVTKKEINKDKNISNDEISNNVKDETSIESNDINNQKQINTNNVPANNNYCRYCGSKLPENSLYCLHCGKKIN